MKKLLFSCLARGAILGTVRAQVSTQVRDDPAKGRCEVEKGAKIVSLSMSRFAGPTTTAQSRLR